MYKYLEYKCSLGISPWTSVRDDNSFKIYLYKPHFRLDTGEKINFSSEIHFVAEHRLNVVLKLV